jgi:hypothetical protein
MGQILRALYSGQRIVDLQIWVNTNPTSGRRDELRTKLGHRSHMGFLTSTGKDHLGCEFTAGRCDEGLQVTIPDFWLFGPLHYPFAKDDIDAKLLQTLQDWKSAYD